MLNQATSSSFSIRERTGFNFFIVKYNIGVSFSAALSDVSLACKRVILDGKENESNKLPSTD